MFVLTLDAELELRLLEPHDAPALLALINANRSHLRAWLPWVDGYSTEEDSHRFIMWCQRRFSENRDIVAGLWYQGALVGMAGLHGIDPVRPSAFIGYWIAEAYQGRGIVTRGIRVLINHAFTELQVHRIEIRCAPGNPRSNAIPLRLGFRHEGTLREAERLYDRYEDSLVYGMLRSEWPGTQ